MGINRTICQSNNKCLSMYFLQSTATLRFINIFCPENRNKDKIYIIEKCKNVQTYIANCRRTYWFWTISTLLFHSYPSAGQRPVPLAYFKARTSTSYPFAVTIERRLAIYTFDEKVNSVHITIEHELTSI